MCAAGTRRRRGGPAHLWRSAPCRDACHTHSIVSPVGPLGRPARVDGRVIQLEPLRDRCFVCRELLAVQIVVDEEGFPAGHPKHGFAFYHIWIGRCPMGHMQGERYDHDCFKPWDPDEPPDGKAWCSFDPAESEALIALLQSRCGRLLDGSCSCSTHEALRAAFHGLPYRTEGSIPVSLRIHEIYPPRISLEPR